MKHRPHDISDRAWKWAKLCHRHINTVRSDERARWKTLRENSLKKIENGTHTEADVDNVDAIDAAMPPSPFETEPEINDWILHWDSWFDIQISCVYKIPEDPGAKVIWVFDEDEEEVGYRVHRDQIIAVYPGMDSDGNEICSPQMALDHC